MIDCGRTLRSNEDTAPRVPAGPARRLFSRTSVRFAPRPRNEIVEAPGPPSVTKFDEIALVTCAEPEAIGLDCSISAVSNTPRFSATSGSITAIGDGLLKVVRLIRDPV